jgi:hypothetical protein
LQSDGITLTNHARFVKINKNHVGLVGFTFETTKELRKDESFVSY